MLDANRLLWIGGDGSARVYTRDAAHPGVYRAPPVDHPDSITADASGYTRWARNRVRIAFDQTGLHVSTTNRLGHVTTFAYKPGTRLLTAINVPTAVAPLVYNFSYDSSAVAGGVLASVGAPAPAAGAPQRVTTIGRTGARITSVTGPDSATVQFGYGTGASSNVVQSRTDRLGRVELFLFDGGFHVSRHQRTMEDGSVVGEDFRVAESVGLPGAGGPAAVPPDSVYTRVDAPRIDVADVTKFWVNAYGAPTRVRNPLGAEQRITYDANWPGLASATLDATRLFTKVWYNGRGLADSSTVFSPYGTSLNATARYAWDATWDAPVQVTAPDSVVSAFSYDASTGSMMWAQTGGTDRRVNFGYGPLGLITTVTEPLSGPRRLYYDGLGNVRMAQTAIGFTALTFRDAIGRDTLSYAPLDSATGRDSSGVRNTGTWVRTTYDVLGRVKRTVQWGPGRTVSGPSGGRTIAADSVAVEHAYDAQGNPKRTTRSYSPPGTSSLNQMLDTWDYDAADRVTSHWSSTGQSQSYAYDPAGNRIRTTTSRGNVITEQYDAAGQLVRRILPQINYSPTPCYAFSNSPYDCAFSLPTKGLTCIAADTAFFAYDLAGRLRTANNRAAQISRSYFPVGLLGSDVTRVRTYFSTALGQPCEEDGPRGATVTPGDEFNRHVYTLQMQYDVAGRRTSLKHADGTASYAYQALTGELRKVTDPLGDAVLFTYDAAGRLSTTLAHGRTEAWMYDADGRVRGRTVGGFGTDDLSRDAVGRVVAGNVWSLTGQRTIGTWYSGLGAVLAAERHTGLTDGSDFEEFAVDAIGNRTWRRQYMLHPSDPDQDDERLMTYDSGSGQLSAVTAPPTPMDPYGSRFKQDLYYDQNGNSRVTFEVSTSGRMLVEHLSASYYDAEERLRIFNSHVGIGEYSGDGGIYEEYRYDALGRRVLTRSRGTKPSCYAPGCTNYIERTVWDGDQVLAEIRADGADDALSRLEDDNAYSSDVDGYPYGRVYYTHASGIDAPVLIARQGMSGQPNTVVIAPISSWRGGFQAGIFSDGRAANSCAGLYGCPVINFPDAQASVDGANVGYAPSAKSWFGSLLSRKADQSGLQYMRNRYYDPATGRFTQPDPIGLAGGLNAYGFAAGDPVNYSDPFGLNPCLVPPAPAICAAIAITVAAAAWEAAKTVADIAQPGHSFSRLPELIPTAGPRPTAGERGAVNDLGEKNGCMTCGAATPGTKSGNWIPNHVPPTSVKMPGEGQQLGPHCQSCSNTQGGWLSGLLRGLGKAPPPPPKPEKEAVPQEQQ
ncbi:MAG: RHS repeat-associated core domain-containing protein [Gemmatimonadaceae bacterium]